MYTLHSIKELGLIRNKIIFIIRTRSTFFKCDLAWSIGRNVFFHYKNLFKRHFIVRDIQMILTYEMML